MAVLIYRGELPDVPPKYDSPRGVFFASEIHWENEHGTRRRLLRAGQRCGLEFAAAVYANLTAQGATVDVQGYEPPEPEPVITPADVAKTQEPPKEAPKAEEPPKENKSVQPAKQNKRGH